MRAGKNGKILVVEDEAAIVRLQKLRLEQAGYEVVCAATTAQAMDQIRQGGVELIVLDNCLGGSGDGLAFFLQLKAQGYNLPVIMVTGYSDEATVIKALRAGVRDYLTKSASYLNYLPEAVGRVLKEFRTEQELIESRARLVSVISSAQDAIITVDADDRITLFNPAAEEVFACPAFEAIGQSLRRFIPERLAPAEGEETRIVRQPGGRTYATTFRCEARGVDAGGRELPLEVSVSDVEAAGRRFRTIILHETGCARNAGHPAAALPEEPGEHPGPRLTLVAE